LSSAGTGADIQWPFGPLNAPSSVAYSARRRALGS
jgi:hypothetical protein